MEPSGSRPLTLSMHQSVLESVAGVFPKLTQLGADVVSRPQWSSYTSAHLNLRVAGGSKLGFSCSLGRSVPEGEPPSEKIETELVRIPRSISALEELF